jgi:hypothetical protein
MQVAMDACKAAGKGFINAMQVDDEAAIISFGSTPKLHQAFTKEKPLLLAAIDSIAASGATTLWDALFLALQYMPSATNANRSIIVVSDGADGSSTRNMTEVSNLARLQNVRIMTIALGPGASTTELDTLARRTAGRFYAVQEPAALIPLFASLVDSLVTSYDAAPMPTSPAMTLFPQPGRNELNVDITLGRGAEYSLSLHDVFGREMLRKQLSGGDDRLHERIDLAGVPPGIYFVQLRRNAEVILERRCVVAR